MRILRYKCTGRGQDRWDFSEIELGRINLLVGDTATGKTRFLNTVFNITSFVTSDKFMNGYWDMTFRQSGSIYRWEIETGGKKGEESRIVREKLWIVEDGSETQIIDRSVDHFAFKGKDLPKLPAQTTSISLLKEEDDIGPIYEGFGRITRRRFFRDELMQLSTLISIPATLIDKFRSKPLLRNLYDANLALNVNIFILSVVFPKIFNAIRKHLKSAFPFIADSAVKDWSDVAKPVEVPGEIPVFCIREKQSNKWIPLPELSSGMQKVLLILTDTHMLPDEAIYMIDEYENSLGISAIDFFPGFLLGLEKEIQFFVTSHHPYIINEIPPRNWYIFHRKGTSVSIKYGQELEARFGKSKQKAFIQLINDPFYVKGVE